MSNGNTAARILSQLVDADRRNELESPTARVARARQETQELHQRINRLTTYNEDNVRDYTEDDTQSNGLFEFGKMVKDNTVRTVRGLDQSRRRFDVSQNTETYNFSPEQRNVEDLLTSGKQNQEKMNYLRDAIIEAEAKGQTETANFYKQELIQTQRLKTLYGLTPSEASIADSPVTNADTANQINEGMSKYGRGGFSRKEKQIESLQNTSLSDYVDKNAARLDLGQVYESLSAKRASQDNFQAIRDRQKTFAGEDGEQGSDAFINSIKALGENPESIAYNAGQILPYMLPGVGTLQLLADIDNFANTTENNSYADTGKGIRSDEERDRAAVAYGLNIPVSYLDRLLGKAATGGAGVGGKITGALSSPITKANEKIIAGLAGNKSQALYKGTSKALGATTKAGLVAGLDTGTEVFQEGTQTLLEQVGSNRKADLAEISEAAAIGGGVGGAASISGAAAKGVKYASGKGFNKVKEKVAESRAPMNDDEYLDSNSKKYSPVSVVEDANKALSTGNASRETIKESKARIDNAKKSVNKEIQELERIVSLKTKQQQLIEQFKDADSISDSDMKIIENNAEAIQNLPYSIKLDVAQERLTAAREAKISMEAEVSRAEAKVAKESKHSTNVAKATKIQELLTEQETNRSRIEEIDSKLSDTNISDTEIATLENEKLKIQNSAMKTATQLSKLDPDGLISEIKASKEATPVTPQSIKEKLSGILKSPEVTANVSKKAELEELGRKLDSVTAQQNTLKKTDSVKGDIVEGGIEGDRKYIGTKEHLSNSINAVDNKDDKAYKNQMRMLKDFETSHASKAKAMNEASIAYSETGKTQLVYRNKGDLTWSFAPKTFFGKNSTRDKKKFGALEVHDKSGRLIKNIEEEAKHIKETREFIEEYKSKVANTNSTSAKGKNVNDKTSNTSNATGSVNTDNNKSKKVKSNKPKVNPVKNKNKNMITSWRQKDDNSGETNRQHDTITELYKEKNKGLKGKPVSELVLRDDERHAYNALSYLANKTIIAPNVNSNNVVWENFAEEAFGENTNAGNYTKDDVVMLVMPQTVSDFNALTPELNKALVAGAEVVYMNPRHTNNEVTKELITDNLVAVVKAKGYTLAKDKSQNKINLGTKVEIFKAIKEEVDTGSNTDTQFKYDKSTWTNGNEKGEPLHSKQIKELEEQDTVNLKEGDLENATVLRPTGKLITNEKEARIVLGDTTYLYNKDGITNLDGSKVPDRVQKAYDKTQENDPAFFDTEKGQELYVDFRGITYDQIDEDGTVHKYRLTFSSKDGKWFVKWEMFFPDLGVNGKWGLISENKKNPESADYEFMLTNFMTIAEDPVNIKHFVGTDKNRKGMRLKAEYDLLGSSDNNSDTNTDVVKLSVSNDEVIKRGWNDKKIEGVPNYEVSSKGNKKFSALYAILKDGRSIEEAYQLDVKGYREIAEKQGYKRGNRIPGKGKTFITSMTEEEGYQGYKNLWETYLKENPELAELLIKQISTGSILTDTFARTVNNQARALAEITKESISNSNKDTEVIKSSITGLEHTVPTGMAGKKFELSYVKDKVKLLSSNLLDESTERYTDGLRDVLLDIITSDKKVKTELNLIDNPKVISRIEGTNGTGSFIADAVVQKNGNSVIRLNLNSPHTEADIKTILTHELSHSATIGAITNPNISEDLKTRLKVISGTLKVWLENNGDTISKESLNSLEYSRSNIKELIAVNTTQQEAIQVLVNIPSTNGSLYQEIMIATVELLKANYGDKITKEIEEQIYVLSSRYENEQKNVKGNNSTVSTTDTTTEDGTGEPSGQTTSIESESETGRDVGDGQTDSNVRNTVSATENEVSQGNKTLLSQDEDIFTSVVLARNWERISEQAGIEIEDNNIRQLEAYIEFHETITKGIEKLIDKRDAPSNLNNALFKYLAVTDDTGKIYLPKNVVAAISLSAFKYIQTEGKKIKLTDAQLLAVHGLDAYTKLYPQAKYKLSELGGHKAYMSQDMGKLAYAALDLSIGDNARVNTKQELEASLGAVVYTLLKTNTDLIKEQPPMKHREQLIRLVQSMPMGQAKDLVSSKTDIDVSTIKNKESLVTALKESKDSYLEPFITLARINNSYDKKAKEIIIPEVGAKVINGSTKNPGQIDLLDKLFSVPRERAEPHDKAPKFTQETAKESRSLITKEATKALNEVASYEWGIEGAKADLMIQLFDTDKDSFYSLIGLSSDAEINNLHSEIRDTELIETITRRNLLDEQIEWLKSRRNEDGTYKPFYQLPVVWQNSRFGYESTLFNAQTDIFARMLTNLKGWKAPVDTNKDAALINEDGTVTKEGLFHLALAEKVEGVSKVFGEKFAEMGYDPLAVTPDKVGPQDYLPEFVNYLETNTEFKQAVSAMRDLLAGETLTEAKLDTLKGFTKTADTGELALGMLVEYISFQDARDAGETYTTYISLQSDGITNGPAITDILFGVFTDEKLLKAGIIPESLKDVFSNFYETKKAGYTDKYQDTGMDMSTVMFTYMPKGTSITDLLSTVDDKFGSRSWAKKLVTPFNYGSGTKSMKRNIANGFVDKVVGDYHSLYNMENKKERDALINQLNTLLSTASDIAINLKANKPVNNRDALVEMAYLHNNNTNDINKQINLTAPDLLLEIMEKTPKFIQTKNEGKSRAEIVYAYSTFLRNNFEVHKFEKITDKNADENFSFSNRELLESLVDISFGTASAKAINTNEAASVAYRQDLTDVTIRAVEMEKFAEDILIDNFIPDSQLPDGLDMSQYDSPLEAKRVYMTVGQKKLIDKEMDKHRATMHSGLSAKYNASRDSGIVVAKEDLTNTFGEQIKFGNPLKTEENSNTQGPSITFTYGYSYKTTSSPGVSASAMAVQSLDAAIATETVSKFKSMNLHDAASFSILDYTDGVRKQNQEFYEAVTTYDIGKEALESYLAPLRLLRRLLDNDSISDKSKRQIRKFIHNEVKGRRVHEKTKQEIGVVKITNSLRNYSATKISKLNTIHTVQQYGGVDGQVVVDKVDTSNMLADIESTIKEAVNLIEGRETQPVEEEVTPIQDVNTSELESSMSTNKLSLTGLIGVLNKAMPDSNVSEILNSLNDINLTKVNVKFTKKSMTEDVRFSKLDNTLYINEGSFNLVGNNELLRDIQRGVLEAALHNNLKAIKNGSTNTGTLTDSYRGMQLLVNALPSMIKRAYKEGLISKEESSLISKGINGVESVISNMITNTEFSNAINKVPNYTDIDSKDIKRGNIFSKIKEFIIDLVTNGFDSPNRESIYNLLTATSNEIVSELQEVRGLSSINGLINQSMIINQNQDSVNHYDYEYDNALLNGYDTQFHLEIAKMAMNSQYDNPQFDAHTILGLAHKLLSNTPYNNDGYNQTLIPVIEMLQKYLGKGNKGTKVVMVQSRESINEITKNTSLQEEIANNIESGRSLAIKLNGTNYVFLSNAMVSSSADTKIATVIHELLHAFTTETLNDPKNSAIKTNFEKMRKDALKQVTEGQLESNYQLSYALKESLPIDEFVVQVLTVPSVRKALEAISVDSVVKKEGRSKEPELFSEIAGLFGYAADSQEATFLNNFAKMFGKLTLNNTVSRQSAIEVSSAALGSREAYKTARVKQSLIDIGYLDNIDHVAKTIAEETKDLTNYITELEFIKQKAAENNNAELLDDIAVHEQQEYSQRSLQSPEIIFTPKEVRTRIQENDVSESTNREYLNIIENSILTPLDYLIDDALVKGFRPESIWHDAVVNGENLTVSNAYDVGFKLNNEQGYMLETLESILSKVIDKVNNTAAYRQMESVYKSAKDTLVASDFHDGDWDNATQEEKQIAREKLTYLFRPQDSGIDGKSNYLVRFAALSMVSPEIQAILNFKANNEIVGETWFEKATSLFSEAIEIVDGGFSGVSGKGNLNARITDLALSMAKTYAKENDKLSEIENNVANKIESVTEMFSETIIGAAKEAGIKLTDSELAQKYPIGRLTNKALKGELDRFQEYADFFMDYVGKNSPLGTLRETINETLTDTSKDQELATDSFNSIKLIESMRGKVIDAVRRNILDNYSKENKKMSKEDSKAISNLLRADIQSLRELGLTHSEIMNMVTNRDARNQKAKELLDTLPVDLRNELQSRGDNLGYYLVKGVARKPLLAKNAFAILSRVGMGKGINTNFTQDQVKNLDALITIYALNYSDTDTLNRVADINSKETGDINGLEHSILSHQKFTRESDALFMDNPFSKQKGYIPSIYNTDRGFAIVKRSEVEDYKELGYKENSTLETALNEDEMTNKEDMVFMTLSNTGKQDYVSGAFSIDSPGAKGSSVEFDSDKFVKIAERQRASIDTISQTNMIPIYDTDGNIRGYRYEMGNTAKDGYLDRNNDFSTLLAQFKGANISKENFPDSNKKLVDALIDKAKNMKDNEINSYILISPNSSSKRAREFWAILPKETRMYIENQTGEKGILVKKNELNLLIGYRKYNPSDAFTKEYADKNIAELVYTSIFEGMFGKKAKLRFDQGFKPLLEMVTALKNFIVIRGIKVLIANIKSNIALLMINGFTPIQSMRDIKDALVYSIRYQNQASELLQLEHEASLGYGNTNMVSRMTELRNSIARNPLKAFIEEGMMPMIVNDFSFKKGEVEYNTFVDDVKDATINKLPVPLRNTIDFLTVAEGTKLHNFLANATQQSDFVFKYAIHQQEMRKGKTNKEAIARAREVFINYDIPTNRFLQFINDTGLWMFTKFALRIQRVILRLMKEKPLRLATEALVSEQLGNPSIISLNLISAAGGGGGLRNPMTNVLSMYEHALPIQLLTSVFK